MFYICMVYYKIFLMFSIVSFLFSLYFLILDYSLIIELVMLSFNSMNLIMTILFDWMSLLFMSFVLFISSMVIYYSNEYMSNDKSLKRFIMLVSMFVLSMMLLIISPNLISILLGWDGLGLVSYCLVIYYQNIKSYNAGMLTALTNRIGDVAFLLSFDWMMNFGSWTYYFYVDLMKNDLSMMIISCFMVLAAMTKSAQIPFSSWLPAAMAAPTPVSSLVHSSTLVTAGIYLLIRFNLSLSNFLMMFMLFIGSMTMFMAGLGANFEFDFKKIIALSTLSQLGLMMSILSLGEMNLAFFHLLTHALFKATLFMCAGCIIHNLLNCQDICFMGGLINFMPLTSCFFLFPMYLYVEFLFYLGFIQSFNFSNFINKLFKFMYLFNFFYFNSFNCLLYFSFVILFNIWKF